MTAVRIVCTYDAKKLAETLARLLGAEDHEAQVSFGRQSLDALPQAREAREAVVLVWSYEAPSAQYMLDWANAIPPERLAEIARAPGWPQIKRRSPVIDFSTWRGERGGGRAWNALTDRLRVIAHVIDPRPAPPRRAAIAVGLVGAVAAGMALMVRPDEAASSKDVALEQEKVTLALIDGDGMGGPMDALEPASIDDAETMLILAHSLAGAAAPLPDAPIGPLAALPRAEAPQLYAPPTLVQRLSALNPMRRED